MPNPNGKPMVTFAELHLPERARRALSKDVGKPTLLTRGERRVKVSSESEEEVVIPDQVECPHCKGWRPSFCVVKAKGGWRCDGCITDERRREVFEEW